MNIVRSYMRTAEGVFRAFTAARSSLRNFALIVAGSLLLTTTAIQAASNVQGAINGQVLDADGAPVASATVTVTSQGTGFSRTEATDSQGYFEITSLPVGPYTVEARASGHPAATREGVGVSVGTSTGVTMILGEAAQLEAVTVSGTAISPIDFKSTESATVLGENTVDRIPVGRNLTAVALLAPGTTEGDSAFGDLASFGGASVAENVCYINGLNVTDFRNGLGCSTVPFEFYQEFQLKTGGYSAEFGRSTGGVVNAVTKSGTNEYEYGFNIYYTPWIEDISGRAPNVFTNVDVVPDDNGTPSDASDDFLRAFPGGELFQDNSRDEESSWDVNLYASGPIVRDKAFFYVLYNPREESFEDYDEPGHEYTEQTSDNAFYGAKLDWLLHANHLLELTVFSDQEDIEVVDFAYDGASVGSHAGTTVFIRGGDNGILRYTGFLTPDFTLSASYGFNEYSLTTSVQDESAIVVIDDSQPGSPRIAGQSGGFIDGSVDKRTMYRVDGEWFINDHSLKFGIDFEQRDSTAEGRYSGGGEIFIINADDTVDVEEFRNQGTFVTESSAIYIEDRWQITDKLLVNFGIRNEAFRNEDAFGRPFVDLSNQIAPRIGVSWDALGNGTLKVYGNYGRYHIPVANNTNVRGVGGEFFRISTFEFEGLGSGNIPQLGDLVGTQLLSDGSVHNPQTFGARNIEPMYQDELILGFMRELDGGWSIGTRATYREFGEVIEDMILGAPDTFNDPFGYALGNPGRPVTVCEDINQDEVCEEGEFVTYSVDELQYPKPERQYAAVEFLFERPFDGVWFLQGSYTWSHSYGNYEGWVRSDNGQDDAGIVNLFDLPGLTDGAYGDLPNDRRHALKVFGAWQFSDHWQVGANFAMESGRPVNVFGNYPDTGAIENAYRVDFFYQEGLLAPRGTRGLTAFTTKVDVSLKYLATFGETDVVFGLDVFNLFNSTNITEVFEFNEIDVPVGGAINHPVDPRYGLATAFEAPRAVRFSAQFDF